MPHRQMLRQIRVQLESKGHGSVQSHPDKNESVHRKDIFLCWEIVDEVFQSVQFRSINTGIGQTQRL